MAGKRKKYYAVLCGRVPGLYQAWEGGAKEQVSGFPGAKFRGFESREEAITFLDRAGGVSETLEEERKPAIQCERNVSTLEPGKIYIFSDGCALGNPGSGGYGVIVVHENGKREELSSGFSLTTNNRMELMAALAGLRTIRDSAAEILVTSDSSYFVNGMEKGWAAGWKARNWKKADGKPALNIDLWAELLELVAGKKVSFRWVRGHAGHPENERCDVLAKAAAKKDNLPQDTGYVPPQDSGTLPGFA